MFDVSEAGKRPQSAAHENEEPPVGEVVLPLFRDMLLPGSCLIASKIPMLIAVAPTGGCMLKNEHTNARTTERLDSLSAPTFHA
jgi:hypothetical protein